MGPFEPFAWWCARTIAKKGYDDPEVIAGVVEIRERWEKLQNDGR